MRIASEGQWERSPDALSSRKLCKQGVLTVDRLAALWGLYLVRTGRDQAGDLVFIGSYDTLEQAEDAGNQLAEDEPPNVHVMRIKAAVANNAFPYCKACERWLTVRDKFLDGPWTQFHYLEDGEMCPEQITWVMGNVKNPRLQTPDPETVLCE